MGAQNEKLIESIRLYLRQNGLDTSTSILNIQEWIERDEPFLNDSEFVIVSEGGLWFDVNFGDSREFDDLIDSFNYYYEIGNNWSYGFYKNSNPFASNNNEKQNYTEKLSDPRWIKKRDFVKEYANYKCRDCGSSDSLEVHHCYYVYGLEPWQYPFDTLRCLCNKCHKRRGFVEKVFRAKLTDLSTDDIEMLSRLVSSPVFLRNRKLLFKLLEHLTSLNEISIKNFVDRLLIQNND